MSIQLKIALLFTIICTAVIVGLSCAVYFFTNANAFQDIYVRLELRATIAAKMNLDSSANTEAYAEIRNQYLQRLPAEQDYILPLSQLSRMPDTGALSVLPADFLGYLQSGNKVSYRDGFRFFRGIPYRSGSTSYGVIISAEHPYAQQFLNSLERTLIAVNVFATAIIFLISFFFARNILQPIRRIAAEANEISATSLNKRLSYKEGRDEIAVLATTFNNMLSRLETSFQTQNNFVSNASHELNTPLTAIIGEAELALAKDRSKEQYISSLQVVLNHGEKLRNITQSLLELAQSGFSGNLSFEPVSVEELVERVREVTHRIYPDCDIVLDRSLQPESPNLLLINGHFHLLELCLSNILLNACKYSTGGSVVLAVASSNQHVILIIRDQGIGIPAEDLPHIFDPFFRASNVRMAKGYGIGLPLAQNIVKLHKGRIDIASREKEGTEVILRIPRLRQS